MSRGSVVAVAVIVAMVAWYVWRTWSTRRLTQQRDTYMQAELARMRQAAQEPQPHLLTSVVSDMRALSTDLRATIEDYKQA